MATDEKMLITQADLNAMPYKSMSNETVDVLTPQIRPSMIKVYPLFIAMYALLSATGTFANWAMTHHVVRNKLYVDATYRHLLNLAICNTVIGLILLPMTLAVLLVENWIFEEFLCYSLPILQDMTIHVSMMTSVLTATDRYRFLGKPRRAQIPVFVGAVGPWFFAACIALLRSLYNTYLNLESIKKKHFQGLGICVMNILDDMEQYARVLLLLTYIIPLAIIVYFFVKASQELRLRDRPLGIVMLQSWPNLAYSNHNSRTSSNESSVAISMPGFSAGSHTSDGYNVELDVRKESRTQKYLIYRVSTFAILLCPLMVLKLAKLAMVETHENAATFDILFATFVWLAYTSTVATPMIYASWHMSRIHKVRLLRWFRCCKRQSARPRVGAIRSKHLWKSRQRPGPSNVSPAQAIRLANIPDHDPIALIPISTSPRFNVELQHRPILRAFRPNTTTSSV